MRTSAQLRPGRGDAAGAAPVTLAAADRTAPPRPPWRRAAAGRRRGTVAPPSPGRGGIGGCGRARERRGRRGRRGGGRGGRENTHGGGHAEPVSAAQAEALGPALGPSAEAEQSADPTDYSVAHDETIRVAAEETLGHYADWLGVGAARLRELNHLKFRTPCASVSASGWTFAA